MTIWTRFPVLEILPTVDVDRTTAGLVDAPGRPLLVYGTVLPWHTDKGPTGVAKNWSEHHRIIPEQGAEWARLGDAHPTAALVVAGDLNTTVGCSRYYGTKLGRQLLDAALAGAGLVCVTAEPNRPEDRVVYPFIDHVCVSKELAVGARVLDAWEGTVSGARLSDHSGVVIEVADAAPGSA